DLVASSGMPAFNIESGRLTPPFMDAMEDDPADDLGLEASGEPEFVYRRPLPLSEEDRLEDNGP
ncbi:MAG: hypothetical protein ORN25_06410, partial [Caulobacteraceae bacterium]|nr:hypothetical protein [Caulobacteraceae bacterium]